MAKLRRLSVSLDEKLVEQFDRYIQAEKYPTRSKAIGDLIREVLVKKEWVEGKDVAGAIILVYDHHNRNIMNTLTHIQHDYHQAIISTQHIHLDHDNCLEVIIVRGKTQDVEMLARKLKCPMAGPVGQNRQPEIQVPHLRSAIHPVRLSTGA